MEQQLPTKQGVTADETAKTALPHCLCSLVQTAALSIGDYKLTDKTQ